MKAVALLVLLSPARADPGQVLVLGVHHSATSIATRALNLLGLHVGSPEDLIIDAKNPLKYWERKDVVEMDKSRLVSGTSEDSRTSAHDADIPPFVGYGFSTTQGASLSTMSAPKDLVSKLNEHRPWVTKDPRMSLVASEWLEVLDTDAVCVISVRCPVDFANTMLRYSRALSMSDWGNIWLHYMNSALHSCKSQPIALVDHAQLVRDPVAALNGLRDRLVHLGVKLDAVDVGAVAEKLNIDAAPMKPTWLHGEKSAVSEAAHLLYSKLHAAVSDPTALSAVLPHAAPAAWPTLSHVAPHAATAPREAYATILTVADKGYLAGALVLGSSIRAMDAARPMVALLTKDLPNSWAQELTAAGWKVKLIERIPEFWWGRSARCHSFEMDQDLRWGHMASKLRLWQQTQYDAVLYLDADTVLTGDASSLFAADAPLVAEQGVKHKAFNAGAMLLHPSEKTFADLMVRAAGLPPQIFGNTVDCTEQGLLNAHFDDRDAAHTAKRFNVTHPFEKAAPPDARRPAVAHWITTFCPKPWDFKPWSAASIDEGCDAGLYQSWWRLYNRTSSSVLATSAHASVARRRSRSLEYIGCSPGCPDFWVNDGICDADCNVEECGWDGSDCYHDASECFNKADASDYRGKVHTTKSGRECQAWSDQEPWHHTRTVISYPDSGLGGHNYCRNPDGEPTAWCYTMDYPNKRFEHCDVGEPASNPCEGSAPAVPAVNNSAAAETPPDSRELKRSVFASGRVGELEMKHYEAALEPTLTGLKVILMPINGDADLFLSFTTPQPTRRTATWMEESVGVKQFTLQRSNPYWCEGVEEGETCKLYLTVSGFEAGEYKLIYYNYTEPYSAGAQNPGLFNSDDWSCSPGCNELELGNTICNPACNTSDCIWDQGDCGYFGEYDMEKLCASGCPMSWIGDGYCDDACFNEACNWDSSDGSQDCTAKNELGCADGCLPSWLDDEECDELCNTEACGWDGSDCDHSADECYAEPDGTDYRGSIAVTKSGKTCQVWAHQSPQQHTRTYANFPSSGLGGHNHCRNPEHEEAGPWCYTTDPMTRWELCDVPPPSSNCTAKLSAANPYHYATLCPVDCANLLGNGVCNMRCNITSCAFDRGDCGVGLDIALVVAGYTPAVPLSSVYLLLGIGIATGVAVGLLVLKYVVRKMKKKEEARRGYSEKEMTGMDGVDEDDLANS